MNGSGKERGIGRKVEAPVPRRTIRTVKNFEMRYDKQGINVFVHCQLK